MTAPPAPEATQASAEPRAGAAAPSKAAASFLLAWNAAIDQARSGKLQRLYADEVLYYGTRQAADFVLRHKREALARASSRGQRVSDVHIARGMNGFVVTFTKHYGASLSKSIRARLVLDETPHGLRIVEETDAATDARLARAPASGCVDALLDAVGEHPYVRADVQRVQQAGYGVQPGGLVYEEESGLVDAAWGYMHPERFETRLWIRVEEGDFTVTDALTMERLTFFGKALERVRAACGLTPPLPRRTQNPAARSGEQPERAGD